MNFITNLLSLKAASRKDIMSG